MNLRVERPVALKFPTPDEMIMHWLDGVSEAKSEEAESQRRECVERLAERINEAFRKRLLSVPTSDLVAQYGAVIYSRALPEVAQAMDAAGWTVGVCHDAGQRFLWWSATEINAYQHAERFYNAIEHPLTGS